MIRSTITILAGGICWLAVSHTPTLGAASRDPDWPCIQRKVPHISAGMMWAGPPVDEQDRSWEKSEELSALVHKLASRRLPVEKAEAMIADFAKQQGDQKNRQLTLLFTGLLQTINEERNDIIRGIARYAHQQAARAERIKKEREELAALYAEKSPSDEVRQKRNQLEEKLNWDTRIFDEREQSLTYVCESPKLLEQRLFALARAIQQHLD